MKERQRERERERERESKESILSKHLDDDDDNDDEAIFICLVFRILEEKLNFIFFKIITVFFCIFYKVFEISARFSFTQILHFNLSQSILIICIYLSRSYGRTKRKYILIEGRNSIHILVNIFYRNYASIKWWTHFPILGFILFFVISLKISGLFSSIFVLFNWIGCQI